MTLGGRSYHANLRSTPARGTYPRFCSGNNSRNPAIGSGLVPPTVGQDGTGVEVVWRVRSFRVGALHTRVVM